MPRFEAHVLLAHKSVKGLTSKRTMIVDAPDRELALIEVAKDSATGGYAGYEHVRVLSLEALA